MEYARYKTKLAINLQSVAIWLQSRREEFPATPPLRRGIFYFAKKREITPLFFLLCKCILTSMKGAKPRKGSNGKWKDGIW